MYRLHYDSWGQFAHRQPRPLKSVVLRDGLIESLIDDVKSFASRRDWYVERGVPYRRGYMLYGPPGTGKSSTVVAIASALKMHIAVLNLMSGGLSDDQLITALANPPDNSLILIEDIDCVFDENRDSHEDKKNSITFSGLLNAIDGVSAGEGRILFATTNHIDRIDPALIRPGRIDRRELIDYPNREQAERMFLRFFPNSDEHCRKAFTRCVNGDGDVRVSAAAIQAHLVKYSHSPILAASETHELYTTKDATT
jgi:chaperone BCS1